MYGFTCPKRKCIEVVLHVLRAGGCPIQKERCHLNLVYALSLCICINPLTLMFLYTYIHQLREKGHIVPALFPAAKDKELLKLATRGGKDLLISKRGCAQMMHSLASDHGFKLCECQNQCWRF